MFRSKKKREAEILANNHKIKGETFEFGKIEKYFLNIQGKDFFQVISDKSYHDLDLDEIFMFLDRTASRVGQQLLYSFLRTIPEKVTRNRKIENIIKFYAEHPKQKEAVLLQISRLNSDEAYYLASLFQEDHISRPKWFWVIYLLSLCSIVSILLSFFYPQFLIVLFSILGVNYFIHYWNKKNLYQYTGSIPQLLVLNQVAKWILKSKVPIENAEEITKATQSIDSLGKKMLLFKLEATFKSDIGAGAEHFAEMLKALFLIEPIVLFKVIDELCAMRQQLHAVYKAVGEIDVAISVNSMRGSLAYYTYYDPCHRLKYISAKDIYHPLLINGIPNSIELDGTSALLTGSNMSGKTTFIRTVGVNAIVAQTLNTCFAREFTTPRLRVHSAIRISDDIMSDKSYYFEEVLTIKNMLEESRNRSQNLFLLDELFKGTNTVERIAAGKSVLQYLNREDNIVFISTHDLEMANYLKGTYSLFHFTEVVENESILFDYKIKAGNLTSTNAIRILELNDYPVEVIDDARQSAAQINELKVASGEI